MEPMIQVNLYSEDSLAGTLFFYDLPLESRLDFTCHPRELLSFAEIDLIAQQLQADASCGRVKDYAWKRLLGSTGRRTDRRGRYPYRLPGRVAGRSDSPPRGIQRPRPSSTSTGNDQRESGQRGGKRQDPGEDLSELVRHWKGSPVRWKGITAYRAPY